MSMGFVLRGENGYVRNESGRVGFTDDVVLARFYPTEKEARRAAKKITAARGESFQYEIVKVNGPDGIPR